jgi:hypothetical protein
MESDANADIKRRSNQSADAKHSKGLQSIQRGVAEFVVK